MTKQLSSGRSGLRLSDIRREMCARVEIINTFAIYDVSTMDEITGDPALDPPAWLELEVVVIDESNFKTNENWRRMKVTVLSPKMPSKRPSGIHGGMSGGASLSAGLRFLSPMKKTHTPASSPPR